MPAALVITGGRRTIVHSADLWEPCICGTTHYDLVVTDESDFWYRDAPQRRTIARTIADAFRGA